MYLDFRINLTLSKSQITKTQVISPENANTRRSFKLIRNKCLMITVDFVLLRSTGPAFSLARIEVLV